MDSVLRSIILISNNNTMLKNALTRNFNYGLEQRSSVVPDYCRVIKRDSDGKESICFQQVDYASYQKSLGSAEDWSLNSLQKAGINPNFAIHTGFGTRLEGLSELARLNAIGEKLLEEAAVPVESPKTE